MKIGDLVKFGRGTDMHGIVMEVTAGWVRVLWKSTFEWIHMDDIQVIK